MFGDRQRPMVLVLGLGESGLAIARWCARHGCRLRIADTREAPPNLAALQAEGIDAEFVGGAFTPALLDGGVEIVGLSPGLSPLEPALAALVAAANERGIAVWGELEFFAQALRALGTSGYQPKVLAITGTNGKTTTTSLTGLLCQRSGKKVAVAGNISPAMLDRLASAIDETALPDVWVLELSSFQLETARTFAPDAAAILNITQDHLDWHGSFDAYAQAKGRIFGATTTRVLNRDDAAVMKFAPAAGAADAPRTVTFGLNEPTQDGDYGLSRDNGIAWLVEAVDRDAPDEATTTRRRKRDAAHTPDIAQKRLMPADALRIRGLHNAANALAAFALARAIDLPAAPLLHALREYRGEAHRVEVIATIDDVDYVDDSKGTNVGATVAALDGLAQKIVLIAGGDGKGQDFAPLVAPVARWCRAVMLIGRDAPVIRDTLAETGVPLADHATLEAAVHAAAELAEPGDAVLLSPACASLDMFRNYAHRAEVFRAAVDAIAIDKGATP
ncbi:MULTISPECIES: UDP-N-acetylmuramoyl-L-alanine--D-glutamate ligase [Burkholderia cepacia complex]|uniref:UDP-N-acetylmuramoyl-L-alanine--D-glutamate ligase n=1 Tax=Burkholderia cepacia complex TaxID=87882 RepID=UPI000980BA76|nr:MULTISPECIES: UDP-N-acetylmuramoyl-L-alanine--D-glutamate ligase [Burkholderia cepacia complex]AQQ27634.1 UDP-N-acetylmuramoyl-L-alanine--D-glutamate ligase [Burkholderia cenocepacia]MBK1819882.1 UDP-N-acetylmuramoyl-L-alanine--D-glutamate ligase [Burkholderia orbicola]MBR8401850.1 UDP-N-acetylmuramoyl-L-alanine--D-glutamate ligase [Burkholderia cenocepacia]ONV85926.1 UDP-N-acetylmuramoyl-L-alanine--D-glutamate ligase [Burkholderia cenocepacia]ONW09547.1 UDP-N-acetylmuramoyl-L-alanine--D-gl